MSQKLDDATPPFPELSCVRLLIAKRDDKGRPVAAGTRGTIVHVHRTPPGAEPAYVIEVVIQDAKGMQCGAHIFDALHGELEPV